MRLFFPLARKGGLEQVTGFEPVSSAWQAEILAIILYLHGISGARAGPALSSVTTPESGAYDRNRTCNRLITNQLRCQLRHVGILVSRGFEPLNAYFFTLQSGHAELPWVSTGNYGPV